MTPVDTSTTSEVVPNRLSNEDFKFGRINWFGFTALGFLVLALAVMMFQNENKTIGNLKNMADYGSTPQNLVVAEHESLMFAVSFERWLSGSITRRDLQIRRALLAQRLEVFDNKGIPSGTRISVGYLKVLRALDDYIALAPPGFLLPGDRTDLRAKSALKSFIFETNKLGSFVIEGSDEKTHQLVRDANFNRAYSYVPVVVVLTLIFTVAGFLLVVRLRYFRKIHFLLEHERQRNEETDLATHRADDELRFRIDKERMDRSDREWIDSTVNSILSLTKGTVIPDEIADTMVESLGRTLKVDFVIFYSYGKFRRDELWRQWSQTPATQIDFSRIAKYKSNLLDSLKNLGEGGRAIVVSDTRLINVSRGPFPEIVAISKELARSFMLVPIGEEIHGLGYMWLGMKEQVRVWSPIEAELIQQVASNSAQSLAHAWRFGQTMQIAENAATVNRLIELDKVKNDFIENMNHELRTPLTSIIGYMEMIVGDINSGVEPELVASLSVVQRNARRLQILIENLSQLSKTEFQRVPLLVVTVDVGHMLGDAIKSMELTADHCGVGVMLRLDSPTDDLLIDGDVNQLQQVFVNLLSNAVKFTLRGGKVTVVARRVHTDGSDFVEVTVTDTGIGIPPEEFPNVFNRFFRASTATQAAIPGFGIGLSLAHLIVGEHHGMITFDSTVGKGTVFTVILPLRYTVVKPLTETM